MKKNADTVRYEVDLDSLPPLTDKQKVELAALSELPDDQIDYSDIPFLTDEQLENAGRGRFYRPIKQQITARVDADVLDWLKSQGKGYQARLNAILRKEMLASMKSQKRAR
nr:BrnA antitoxin family protein [Rhizobium terrae]